MSGEVGSNDTNNCRTLHEVLHGKPDPMAPHFEKALASLRVVNSAIWRQTLEAMAGTIRHASQRGRMPRQKEGGDTEFFFQRGYTRVYTKKELKEAVRAAKYLIDLTDRDEIRDAISMFAPRTDYGSLFEQLRNLASGAKGASAKIKSGGGRNLLRDDLGIPSPKLLCAACVREAMRASDGRYPSATNRRALEACRTLWLAAGGSDRSKEPGGLWQRHLGAAKGGTRPAARSARSAARWHVAFAVQK